MSRALPTAGQWDIQHKEAEAGRSAQGHLQLHSKFKARWGSEELSKASKNATKLPALQGVGVGVPAFSAKP